MEQEPQDKEPKFGLPRDEVLYRMAREGWAMDMAGATGSPPGWMAIISASPDDVNELIFMHSDELVRIGIDDPTFLVGHFLIIENDKHFVTVIEYEDQVERDQEFNIFKEAYDRWATEEDQ